MPANTVRVAPPRSSVEPEQLVGAFDRLGARDLRHAQVELVEIFDADGVAHGLLLGLVLLLLGVALRRRGLRGRYGVEQLVELLFFHAAEQVAVLIDAVSLGR